MKKIKLLVTAYCLLGFCMLFAAEYDTVYSCGFETGEDMSAWDLANAAAYRAIDDDGPDYQDLFYTGTAVFNSGSQSLYISQDGGTTNTFIPASSPTSCADLNINLPAGTYTLSFDYKIPTRNQRLTLYVLHSDRFDFDIPTIHYATFATAADWTNDTVSFSLTEDTDIWFSFSYYVRSSSDVTEIEGLAIDNIVLKKQVDFVIDEEGVLTDYLGTGGHVVIPDGVKKITEDAFLKGSETITSYYIPASVEVIEEGSLNWDIVESITLDEANGNYSMLDGVLYNRDKTTIICYPAKKSGDTFTIPATVKVIGAFAFYKCSNLTSITIPSGVETVNEGGVNSCENLTSITIPGTVTVIGDQAFSQNSNLTDVTVEWPDPTTVSYGNRIFYLSINTIYTLYVPAGTVDLYSAIYPWNAFDQIVGNTTDIADAKADTARTVAGYYSISGQYLSVAPERGVYIILYNDGTAEKRIK